MPSMALLSNPQAHSPSAELALCLTPCSHSLHSMSRRSYGPSLHPLPLQAPQKADAARASPRHTAGVSKRVALDRASAPEPALDGDECLLLDTVGAVCVDSSGGPSYAPIRNTMPLMEGLPCHSSSALRSALSCLPQGQFSAVACISNDLPTWHGHEPEMRLVWVCRPPGIWSLIRGHCAEGRWAGRRSCHVRLRLLRPRPLRHQVETTTHVGRQGQQSTLCGWDVCAHMPAGCVSSRNALQLPDVLTH